GGSVGGGLQAERSAPADEARARLDLLLREREPTHAAFLGCAEAGEFHEALPETLAIDPVRDALGHAPCLALCCGRLDLCPPDDRAVEGGRPAHATSNALADVGKRPDEPVHLLLEAYVDAKVPLAEADEGYGAVLDDHAALQQLVEDGGGRQRGILDAEQEEVRTRLADHGEAVQLAQF